MTLRKEPPVFTCRCSSLGKLMTPAKSKSGGLSETAKSLLVTWYKEQLYNRRKEIQSKYLSKGIACEDGSITYLNELYGTRYAKNEQYFCDDYVNGTPDIITEDTIIDIKNSFDFTTFPLFSNSLPSRDYLWQVQGYMMLTGKRKGSVIYTLMDTPDELVEKEWRSSGGTGLMPSEFKANYKYTGLASELRIKRFDFEYSEDMANEMIAKVADARKFIQMLKY